MKPYFERDGITIYHGDCREVLPTLAPVDLVLTDPPYGINWKGHELSTLSWEGIRGDAVAPDLGFILGMPCLVIVFGANNFPEQLPHRGAMAVLG